MILRDGGVPQWTGQAFDRGPVRQIGQCVVSAGSHLPGVTHQRFSLRHFCGPNVSRAERRAPYGLPLRCSGRKAADATIDLAMINDHGGQARTPNGSRATDRTGATESAVRPAPCGNRIAAKRRRSSVRHADAAAVGERSQCRQLHDLCRTVHRPQAADGQAGDGEANRPRSAVSEAFDRIHFVNFSLSRKRFFDLRTFLLTTAWQYPA